MNVVLRGNLIVLLLAMPVEILSSFSCSSFLRRLADLVVKTTPPIVRAIAPKRRMKSKSSEFLSMNRPISAASARWICILPRDERVA